MFRDPLDALTRVFGFEGFRGVQAEVVDDVVAGRDVVLVMPTGAGKSICYQVPALVRPGCGLVVSPLIALMEDQVRALRLAGVRAAALNSQTPDPTAVSDAFARGALDLLYVAPERANLDSFRRLAAAAKIAVLAIDEAHCVSQWGHDFRPEYRRLRTLADALPGVPRIALTATADAATRADIAAQLGIAPDRIRVAGFDRPNIRYEVAARRDVAGQLAQFLGGNPGAGILYCPTRAEAEAAAERAAAAGRRALVYHAGLEAGARQANQRAFQESDDAVMAATIAFGMGIDKPDIRFVVHLGLPKSIEAYYQETGRAGRDGEPAVARMLWGAQDIRRARQWIEDSEAGEARKAHQRAQLERLVAFAETLGCRRQPLLRHFGEPDPPRCGNCDNCLAAPETRDVTDAARMLLSAVYRTGQSFGLQHVTRVLRGIADDKVTRFGHDGLALFGIGREMAEAQWLRLGRRLEADGLLVRDGGHRGLSLGPRARAVLKGEAPVAMRVEDWEPRRADRSRRAAVPVHEPDRPDAALFEALRAWRREQAAVDSVPAYVILHDSTLKAIAQFRPADSAALAAVPGIGAAKLDRFGAAILAVVAAN
jgi:ATP-dependent DNA helicase RecQ